MKDDTKITLALLGGASYFLFKDKILNILSNFDKKAEDTKQDTLSGASSYVFDTGMPNSYIGTAATYGNSPSVFQQAIARNMPSQNPSILQNEIEKSTPALVPSVMNLATQKTEIKAKTTTAPKVSVNPAAKATALKTITNITGFSPNPKDAVSKIVQTGTNKLKLQTAVSNFQSTFGSFKG